MVDPLLSTSSALHTYHRLIPVSVEVPDYCFVNNIIGNSSFIGEEPVSGDKPSFTSFTSSRLSATSSEVSFTEQGNIIFTNVLQGHETVVLVCCTIE